MLSQLETRPAAGSHKRRSEQTFPRSRNGGERTRRYAPTVDTISLVPCVASCLRPSATAVHPCPLVRGYHSAAFRYCCGARIAHRRCPRFLTDSGFFFFFLVLRGIHQASSTPCTSFPIPHSASSVAFCLRFHSLCFNDILNIQWTM